MDELRKVAEGLKRMAAQVGPTPFLEARVLSVDKTDYVADLVTEDGLELYECRLRALASGEQSIEVLPRLGSTVLVARLNDDDFLVLACDVIDSYRVTVGQVHVEVSGNVVKLNGEGLGGLVKIDTLVERLNRVEQRQLTHQHIGAAPGSPTLPDPATNAPFALTTKLELENPKVKHG